MPLKTPAASHADDSPSLIANNQAFHKMLTDDEDISWRDNGQERHGKVWMIDRDPAKLDDNEFLVATRLRRLLRLTTA